MKKTSHWANLSGSERLKRLYTVLKNTPYGKSLNYKGIEA